MMSYWNVLHITYYKLIPQVGARYIQENKHSHHRYQSYQCAVIISPFTTNGTTIV